MTQKKAGARKGVDPARTIYNFVGPQLAVDQVVYDILEKSGVN